MTKTLLQDRGRRRFASKSASYLLGASALLGTAGALLPTTAFAASAADNSAADNSAADTGAQALPEIVVSAQKRKETARNIPLSVSVFSAEKLEQDHVADFADLARATPGMAFTNTGNSSNTRISIRGISSSSGSSTVGIYLNDVSLTIPNQFFTGTTLPRLFDLDHVEVLRGPQGTLYGDSSMGGTVKFVTRQPRLNTVEGTVYGGTGATEGGGVNYQFGGAINLPITQNVALRVAAETGYQSGWMSQVVNGVTEKKNANSERYTAVRATLLWEPAPGLKITPALQYQYTSIGANSIFDLSQPAYTITKQVPEPSHDILMTPSLTIEKSFGDYTLTSITAYTYRKYWRQFDVTSYDSAYVAGYIDPTYGSTYNTIANLPGTFWNADEVHNWSEEVRFTSPSIKPHALSAEWQVGAYLNSLKTVSLDDEYVPGLNSQTEALTGDTVESLIGYTAPSDQIGYFHSDRLLKQVAVFAEGSLMLTNRLKATVGIRQAWAWSSYLMNEGGWLADGTPAIDRAKSSNSPFTPKFALTYAVSPHASVYGNVSKGFRLGGQNNSLPSYCGSALSSLGLSSDSAKSYGADSLWSYELGAKTGWLGNRLVLNGSLYRIDWHNLQQQINLTSCGYVTTLNAGNARSQGAELELQARLTGTLSFNATASFTSARITQGASGLIAKAGQEVLAVPNRSATFGLAYRKPIAARRSLFASFDWTYTGKSYGSYKATDSDYARPAYWVGDLDIGTEYNGFTLRAFIKNIANDQTIIQRPQVLFISQGLTVQPRTFGVSLSRDF
ncbi:MAG TPA: TonB-dependent receptor [Novosphingobium sp.]|nr:TonB-dependent receptor [Novosphingobium sp.]